MAEKKYPTTHAERAEHHRRPIPRLQAWRVWRGYSVRGLAERSGVMPITISRLERKKATATLGTIQKLAQALAITTEFLLSYNPPQQLAVTREKGSSTMTPHTTADNLMGTIVALPSGWNLFATAIFTGAVEADHPTGKTPDQVEQWAEREVEDAMERYADEIAQEEDVNPPDRAQLTQAETMFRRVALAAWHEVRKDYRERREELRDLDEIAHAVADTLGLDLPGSYTTGNLNWDRYKVIR